jgi:hypothetical protein
MEDPMMKSWFFVPALLVATGIILFDAAVKQAGTLPKPPDPTKA